jgi:hypothetical protein
LTKNYKVGVKVFNDACIKDWNTWRKRYHELDINDLIWINTALHGILREQTCIYQDVAIKAIGEIVSFEDSISVIELGCYRGSLAKEAIENFGDKISAWVGYDINYHAIDNPIVKYKKFLGVKQTDWFYNVKIKNRFNVFVSTSTLEHHSAEQFVAILERVADSAVKYMLIGMPISQKNWRGYNGSHVLYLDEPSITGAIEGVGFSCFHKSIYRKVFHVWGAKRK